MKLWEGVKPAASARSANSSQLLERNDLMQYGQANRQRTRPATSGESAKLGKKEAAQLAAHQPDIGTPLGELMAPAAGDALMSSSVRPIMWDLSCTDWEDRIREGRVADPRRPAAIR
jgi:hypothetical protein